ncbi:MAG: hypothetical protein MUF42_04620 [Cytophagaceae bacterium]|jgi:hypothetical protein|nr:hypothetical protein [Cytophagaceae bacterium]
MQRFFTLVFFVFGTSFAGLWAQVHSSEFSLASPFSEPDDRHDIVMLNAKDFVTLAKVKGNQSGKSDFVLERYSYELQAAWRVPLVADPAEDYKELFFNGKEIILLSVWHKLSDKTTSLMAYAFDPQSGKLNWNKVLETYQVGAWENHPHKGNVKETFTDVVCEHINQNYITPFEYKHTIQFSPDRKKFISYVYNYGEKKLSASLCVYDASTNLLSKGKVSIDDNYINQGIYLNDQGLVYIVNSNTSGRLVIIQYNLDTKEFEMLDLPGSNFVKDDFQVKFLQDKKLLVACSEFSAGVFMGVMYTRFDFEKMEVQEPVFEPINGAKASRILDIRKKSGFMKGEEDWKDYDITHLVCDASGAVFIVLEKRHLYADGYPHIGRDVFDVSHQVEINGHVQAEGILVFAFTPNDEFSWSNYIPKNQLYPASDGLNSVSFVLQESKNQLGVLYAYSESLDGALTSITMKYLDKQTGTITEQKIPNESKLIPVREYTLFFPDGTMVLVGKRGLFGKTSSIVRFKL